MYTQLEEAMRNVMTIQDRELKKLRPEEETPKDLEKALDMLVRKTLNIKEQREALGKVAFESEAFMSLQEGVIRIEFENTEHINAIYDAIEELLVSSLKVYQHGTV